MNEKTVTHHQACQLLHNKFVVVLGDSIQRSVYKDLVLLLQKDKYLTVSQLKAKGEMSFELDCLVEGGCLDKMNNGTEYREVRQFQSDHHLLRFYFVTRIFSRYMESIMEDIRHGLKPDVIIVNSCLWDISRYNSAWIDNYKENIHKFYNELRAIIPEDTLVIWSLTMPVGETIRGGFLVPEIEHKAPQLRYDVIEANFYSGTLADAYDMDVLDLHYRFRLSLEHRTKDGVHWNAVAHRRITSLLLQHIAQAWGVMLHSPLTADEHSQIIDPNPDCDSAPAPKPADLYLTARNYTGYRDEFFTDSLPYGYLSFEENQRPRLYRDENAENVRPTVQPRPLQPSRRHRQKHTAAGDGPPHYYEPYEDNHHQFVMRCRPRRHHYAPYPDHRTSHCPRYNDY